MGDREHPKIVGDRSTAMVLARLLEHYETALLPFGENQRYDLLIEDHDRFIRVQCKTGRLRNGAIIFNACSSTYHHPSNQGIRPYQHHYRDSADLFGVYCPETDGVYLVPVRDVGTRSGSLRIQPPKNSQLRGIRWASDHEVRTGEKPSGSGLPRASRSSSTLFEQTVPYLANPAGLAQW